MKTQLLYRLFLILSCAVITGPAHAALNSAKAQKVLADDDWIICPADLNQHDATTITVLNRPDDDWFGDIMYRVLVDIDTAFIGAPENDHADFDFGLNYVFIRSNGVWSQQTKLCVGTSLSNWFGTRVSASGNTALIGSYYCDNSGVDSGSVYAFTRSNGVWIKYQEQKLVVADGAASGQFGYSVSVSGDTAIIGAQRDGDSSGSAYVFTRSGTIWTQQQKLVAADGAAYGQFGYSVSVSGDTAVIGAFGSDGNGMDSGSAYVFIRSGTIWTQQQKLVAADRAAYDSFGSSVSVDGDTVLIGAYYDDDAGLEDSGSAYVFTRSGGVWIQQAKLIADDGAAFDYFGYSVSVDGDTAIIGAAGEDGGYSGCSAVLDPKDLQMILDALSDRGSAEAAHEPHLFLNPGDILP